MNERGALNPVSGLELLDQSSALIVATGQIERAMAHHLAHDLNNALGAIEVFSEMLIEDVTDQKVREKLDKMRRAALMARSYVDVLRHAVPKHLSGKGKTSLISVLSLVQKMLGDQTDRFVVTDFEDVMMVGEIGVLTYLLYQVAAHVLGSSMEPVFFQVVDSRSSGHEMVLVLKTVGTVNPLAWEKPFFDDILTAFGARVEQGVSESSEFGFSLHWPCAAV